MSSHMFLALMVLNIYILSSRKRLSLRKFPYEISKSGNKISNFCVSKIGFSVPILQYIMTHSDESNSLSQANLKSYMSRKLKRKLVKNYRHWNAVF